LCAPTGYRNHTLRRVLLKRSKNERQISVAVVVAAGNVDLTPKCWSNSAWLDSPTPETRRRFSSNQQNLSIAEARRPLLVDIHISKPATPEQNRAGPWESCASHSTSISWGSRILNSPLWWT
jgi:hypothetical protein